MVCKYSIAFSFFLFFTLNLIAQIPDKEIIESIIEEITEAYEDEEIDYTSLFEDLIHYAQNPLNLNISTGEDLEKFQFLTDFHIEDILDYQRTAGEMLSIYELQLLESFSYEDIALLMQFVTVEPIFEKQTPNFKRALKYGSNNLFLRTQFNIQDKKGYIYDADAFEINPDTNLYKGNKFKYYTRYQFDYKRKIKFGFVAEKDAGEQFFKDTQKQGFDYYNAHLQFDDVWKFKTITLGDFQVRFGQGLTAWSGFSTGKSSFVMSVKKKYDGLRKYSSSDENRYFRGAGTTLILGNFNLTGFVSYKFIDGNRELVDTFTNEIDFIGTFQTTGLHRTPNEIFDKHSVSEFVYGGNIKWQKTKFKLGASYIQYFFGEELIKNKPYNQFDFHGNNGLNASIDYQTRIKNIFIFGEEAISLNGGFALLNSAVMKLAPQISLAVLQRYYSTDYQAFYAAGFAEQSKTSGENGIYFGTEIHPFRNWKISSYYDIYNFPWLRFNADSPSSGADFFTRVDYHYNRSVSMYIRYKQETKPENSKIDLNGVLPLIQAFKKQFRYQIDYSLSKNLKLKNRIELAQFKFETNEAENGFMIFQDVHYNFDTFPLQFNLRIAYFDAPYNARIYTYENDILYGYSVPGLSGKGIRTYFNIRYTLIKDLLDIWIRFANSAYADKEVIGSSLEEIQGNNRSEVKFQIRFKF